MTAGYWDKSGGAIVPFNKLTLPRYRGRRVMCEVPSSDFRRLYFIMEDKQCQ